jgi:LmbE family N-acetylglucosaminyl deacetylase
VLSLTLPASASPLTVLCLGAHCDDIEIGCGATLLALLAARNDVDLHWHVFTSSAARKAEAERGAAAFGAGARSLTTAILDFRDGYLPDEGAAVKDAMERIKAEVQPDVVFTHYRHDLHQDHRRISELTWNTFRDHLVLEYEIPKWDGDLGTPNAFVDVDEATARRKIALLQEIYNSQKTKRWFTDDLFWSLLRIRGMESNSPSRLAEGFYTRKTGLRLA